MANIAFRAIAKQFPEMRTSNSSKNTALRVTRSSEDSLEGGRKARYED